MNMFLLGGIFRVDFPPVMYGMENGLKAGNREIWEAKWKTAPSTHGPQTWIFEGFFSTCSPFSGHIVAIFALVELGAVFNLGLHTSPFPPFSIPDRPDMIPRLSAYDIVSRRTWHFTKNTSLGLKSWKTWRTTFY